MFILLGTVLECTEWWKGCKVCILALCMQCGFGGIVGFWWPVNTWLRMGVLEAHEQDGDTVSVAWPFPFRSLIEHFRL